jgi:aryl-alcohol dehydrogenase-like predicted oxidoreductase
MSVMLTIVGALGLIRPSARVLTRARSDCRCGTPVAVAEIGMEMQRLGSSDLLVSKCCLGTMTWGNQNTDDDAAAQLDAAFDRGVNFVDTAEGYPIPLSAETQGATDRAIAKWMKSSGRPRDSLVLASKVCGYNERFTWFRGGSTRVSRQQVLDSVDASLARLGTDYLDLLQIHWPDRYVPLFGAQRYEPSKERADAISYEEQLDVMDTLIQSGKIRAWGLSNETPLGVAEFVRRAEHAGLTPPCSVQNSYSLLQRSDECEAVRAAGVGYMPYSPLSAGTLTNKYAAASKPGADALMAAPPGARLRLFPGYLEGFLASEAPKAVARYAEAAASFGMTPSAFAIAFCDSRSFVSSTIIGATALEQLEDCLDGIGRPWTEEMEEAVQSVLAQYPDPWRMLVRDGG